MPIRISTTHTQRPWLSWLVILPFMIVAAMIGFTVLLVVVGLVAVGALAFLMRLWWFRRRMRRQFKNADATSSVTEALDGQYTVVREEARPDKQQR